MKEQGPHEAPPSLHPDTQHLLDEIRIHTGLPVDIHPQPALRGQARAVYVVGDPAAERHRVFYDPKYKRYLDHLIAHECGHIVRLSAASQSERVIPVVTNTQRHEAAIQLLPDVSRLLNRGLLDEDDLGVVLPLWLHGTISQLHNTPPDIHIERWLYREFPDSRERQFASIASQARDFHQAMQPKVEVVTPKVIWRASNAMNYALLKACGNLFHRPDLTRPYRDTTPGRVGEKLLSLLDAAPDTGHAGDRQLSDLWSEHLGLRGWLEWRRLDDLPAEHWHMWERDGAGPSIGRDEREGQHP